MESVGYELHGEGVRVVGCKCRILCEKFNGKEGKRL